MKKDLLLVSLCGVLVPLIAIAAQGHAHWSYAGNAGATHWSELDPSFKTCKLGSHQSPINIETKKTEQVSLQPVVFNYKAESAEVVNNGHTIQVNLPRGSAVSINGMEYQLVQFHFHTPSEEQIDGKAYPMVIHLVHKNDEGKLAVVAVLLKEGKEHPALKSVFDNMPRKEGDKTTLPTAFDPNALLPADRAYYAYEGSLTTPPCSEEVRWIVLKSPVEVSSSELAAFKELYKANARPIQPLNGRVVQAGR